MTCSCVTCCPPNRWIAASNPQVSKSCPALHPLAYVARSKCLHCDSSSSTDASASTILAAMLWSSNSEPHEPAMAISHISACKEKTNGTDVITKFVGLAIHPWCIDCCLLGILARFGLCLNPLIDRMNCASNNMQLLLQPCVGQTEALERTYAWMQQSANARSHRACNQVVSCTHSTISTAPLRCETWSDYGWKCLWVAHMAHDRLLQDSAESNHCLQIWKTGMRGRWLSSSGMQATAWCWGRLLGGSGPLPALGKGSPCKPFFSKLGYDFTVCCKKINNSSRKRCCQKKGLMLAAISTWPWHQVRAVPCSQRRRKKNLVRPSTADGT